MIDFRYHVVSIIAVFLALTVGLVLGASFLSGAQIDLLKGQITSANNAKSTLEGQKRDLTGANKRLLDYIDQTKDNLVAGQLADDAVVVVRAAEADQSAADAVVALARRASANVTADITVNATFTDPSSKEELAALVVDYTPSGQTPSGGDTVSQAMNLFAEALTAQAEPAGTTGAGPGNGVAGAGHNAAPPASPTATPGSTQATMTADWAVRTLTAFKDIGVVSASALPAAASMVRPTAVFIAAPDTAVPDAESSGYLALAQALHARGAGPVVGGTAVAADRGGVIAAVLKSSSAARTVTTVDDIDQSPGQVAVVFSIYHWAAAPTGQAGHYGDVGANDGPLPALPSLAAVPSPGAG